MQDGLQLGFLCIPSTRSRSATTTTPAIPTIHFARRRDIGAIRAISKRKRVTVRKTADRIEVITNMQAGRSIQGGSVCAGEGHGQKDDSGFCGPSRDAGLGFLTGGVLLAGVDLNYSGQRAKFNAICPGDV